MLTAIHQWMTKRALAQAGFAPSMQRMAGEASMWPDWYRWDAPIHAMTPTDAQGMPIDPLRAAQASTELLHEYLQRIQVGAHSEKLVWFGFALHLVQDLAAHEGRTNPEHALQVFLLWQDPDIQPSRIRRGLAFTRRLLAALERTIGSEAYWQLQRGEGYRTLSSPERASILGQRRSMVLFVRNFLTEARLFLTDRTRKRVRWDTERFLTRGLD